jgi:aarF domain-containing kinase
MKTSFGPAWPDNFESFDRIPFAAASIGQVHSAVLSAGVSPTGKPEPVAVKIQFPNITDSIESDLGYVKMLLTAGSLLPKGLFLDKTIKVMKSELHDECDYEREAFFLRKFGSSDFLGGDQRFKVPWVWDGSTKSVLVMERVNGHSVGATAVHELTQRDRDDMSILFH